MKKHVKTIPLFFSAFLLVGSYSYVCHSSYHYNIVAPAQIKENIEESTYQLPDIQVLKHFLGLVEKLIP